MGIYLFGSRARGDHRPDSDADIAIVLSDGDWRRWPETKRLTALGYDFLVETGADLEAWPIRASEWANPALHANPALVRAMRRDARAIGQPDA